MIPTYLYGYDKFQQLKNSLHYFNSEYERLKKNMKEYDRIFVGDCHGDIYQFLSPLILSGFATINSEELKYKYITRYGKIVNNNSDIAKNDKSKIFRAINGKNINDTYEIPEELDYMLTVPIPSLSYHPEVLENKKIIYLGDYIDRGNLSKTILILIDEISNISNNIVFICGNHELYHLYIYKCFINAKEERLMEKHRFYWNFLFTFTASYKKFIGTKTPISIHGDTVLYDGNREKGLKLLFYTMIGEIMLTKNIYEKKKFVLSDYYDNFIIIHNVINSNTLKKYIEYFNAEEKNIPLDYKKIKKMENKLMNNISISNEDYKYLSDELNRAFFEYEWDALIWSSILLERIDKNMYFNCITGHTVGASKKLLNINNLDSYSDEDRNKKLTPFIPFGQKNKIYFFDFGVTFAEDEYNYSKPDFVFFKNGKAIGISRLDAVRFSLERYKNKIFIDKYKSDYYQKILINEENKN